MSRRFSMGLNLSTLAEPQRSHYQRIRRAMEQGNEVEFLDAFAKATQPAYPGGLTVFGREADVIGLWQQDKTLLCTNARINEFVRVIQIIQAPNQSAFTKTLAVMSPATATVGSSDAPAK